MIGSILLGVKCLGLNGGPQFPFNESFSIVVNCDTQEEIDSYWKALTSGGGKEGNCGWLKDKYGLSRLSPKAQARIRREGYHLPERSEQEQIEGLSEDLRGAWATMRGFLLGLGQQELRTSHRSIMFARKTCYAFARPKKAFIELNFFLPRALDSEFLTKVTPVSKKKWVHVLKLTHADQVESPLTDWIREAFEYSGL